jgi:hypothetical protein
MAGSLCALCPAVSGGALPLWIHRLPQRPPTLASLPPRIDLQPELRVQFHGTEDFLRRSEPWSSPSRTIPRQSAGSFIEAGRGGMREG